MNWYRSNSCGYKKKSGEHKGSLDLNSLFDALNFRSSPHKICNVTSGKTNLGIHKLAKIMKVTTTVFSRSKCF